ncbi:hypothetical protein [Aestuariispira ectoiniformans]|uniref:hypothetical protein n=1 Tax=Aestuariispira ectoiniformans TaxID=2775080 RepID=UPI00223B81CE|nr:hypothetical protein [Aestuariispira ectoiniformans]
MIDSLFFAASVICIAIIVIWDVIHRHTSMHGATKGLLQFKLTDEQREELEAARDEIEKRRGRQKRKRR